MNPPCQEKRSQVSQKMGRNSFHLPNQRKKWYSIDRKSPENPGVSLFLFSEKVVFSVLMHHPISLALKPTESRGYCLTQKTQSLSPAGLAFQSCCPCEHNSKVSKSEERLSKLLLPPHSAGEALPCHCEWHAISCAFYSSPLSRPVKWKYQRKADW